MMSRKPRVRDGIGHMARDQWSGQRVTPNQEQQITGFHVGQVMDDQDSQKMGRVWVYIPGVSGKQFDANTIPNYGGTAPDRQEPEGLTEESYDQALRSNWFMVSPMMPFFGSDDFRTQAGSDGRNSAEGDVNSYGMWFQPRIGDHVGVMFNGGDANKGYWMGMVPKQYRNGMVPGVPGTNVNDVSDRDQTEIPDIVSDAAHLPTMDKAATADDIAHADNITASDLSRNITNSGLSGDVQRGAGTSGARRESPSYVTGIKSPGWTYDSEKKNRDQDGAQFETRVNTLSRKNSVGHNLVLDDHPDFQSVRLRSSDGAQLFFNDSCDTPYVYLQTQTGKVWIEMTDSGAINIFAGGSISMHTEGDLNTTVDGNYNLQVNGSHNVLIGGDYRETVAGTTSILREGNEARANSGEYDHRIGGDVRITHELNSDWVIGSGFYHDIQGQHDHSVVGAYTVNTSGSIYLDSSATVSLEGAAVHMNSGITNDALVADTANNPLFPQPGKVPMAPTQEQIVRNENPESDTFLAPVVPQHQPWAGRCGVGATARSNGLVTNAPGPEPAPPSENMTCDASGLSNNTRRGATSNNASRPNGSVGSLGSEPCPTTYRGQPYASDNPIEAPVVEAKSLARPEQTELVDSYNLSDDGLAFIQGQETFIETPRVDLLGRNYVVGYGHVIEVDDVIGGQRITDEVFKSIGANGNDFEKRFKITQEEADAFLATELEEVDNFITSSFPTTAFTQEQYDATTSFIRNIGVDNLTGSEGGQRYIDAVQNGNFQEAQNEMISFAHVGDSVSCDALDRRRAEIDKMGTPVGAEGAVNSIDFVPDGETVSVNGFNIRGDVFNAIANAQIANPELPDGYLFAIAAQESSFNPIARASTSSAAGIFQFIRDTGAQYGLSKDRGSTSNVFDVDANVTAGAQFNVDNLNKLQGAISRPVNSTDLYLAHFLGAGSLARQNGATTFLAKAEANPQGTPATDGFAGPAASNRTIFFNKDGSPKTYEQIYARFATKISCQAQNFANLSALTS